MNMQAHILAALQEQLDRWEGLLAGLSEPQLTSPCFDQDWSIQDVITHLWAWQQVSIARLEAATLKCAPAFPDWLTRLPGKWEESADQTNAWVYQNFHNRPWTEAHLLWRKGFLHMLVLGGLVPERDLLDGDKYPWLNGYSLAFVLVASYEHHQEHLDKLSAWLQEHPEVQPAG
jgi:hypothetical protein